jgi:hypothetical protein
MSAAPSPSATAPATSASNCGNSMGCSKTKEPLQNLSQTANHRQLLTVVYFMSGRQIHFFSFSNRKGMFIVIAWI